MQYNNNPLTPHLQIYKWQISSLLSITHRIVGIINIIAITAICFWVISLLLLGAENYDAVQFHIKNNDKKYLIASIEGLKVFDDNFNDCLKLKGLIVDDLKNNFNNSKIVEDEGNHDYDPTGKSKYYRTSFSVNPKSKYINMSVTCYDWSKKIEDKYADKLSVAISNDEFNDFTHDEAY